MEMHIALSILIFLVGYIAITFEHSLRVNKAGVALVTGVLCWTVIVLGATDRQQLLNNLEVHLGSISGILFFLLGAMVIVELIDAHDGFEFISEKIVTTSRRRILWIFSLIAFLLSAILDNLTTTIVMITLLRKIIPEREQRLLYVGLIVIAANAGGAWSPLGDVTTTMLWIGGQISALETIKKLYIPSLVCILVPLCSTTFRLSGNLVPLPTIPSQSNSTPLERKAVFIVGIGILFLVPLFKTLTHLPPFMGMLLGLGVLWICTEVIHHGKDAAEKGLLSVNHAIRKIDTPSILFFLGILLAISALETSGILHQAAAILNNSIGSLSIIGIIIGFISAIVDNVPLVAAAQGMYSLDIYQQDHFLWQYIAYCTGTGGSALIIGSAAGVAAMGMEKIDFFWYLKNISILAILGYLAGAGVYLLLFA